MADQNKLINDELMGEITGGKASVTPNKNGGVTMVDKNGKVAVYSAQQWQKLLKNWEWSGNAVGFILDVPIEDLNVVLMQP